MGNMATGRTGRGVAVTEGDVMTEIFIMAACAAFGLLFLVLKIGNIRKVLLFDIPIDIGVTVLLMVTMAGTYTGIITAIIAGGIVSFVLWVLKRIWPPMELTRKGWREPGPTPWKLKAAAMKNAVAAYKRSIDERSHAA